MKYLKREVYFKLFLSFAVLIKMAKNYKRLYLGVIPRKDIVGNSPEFVRVTDYYLSDNSIPLLHNKDFMIDGYKPYPISIHTTYKQLWNSIKPKFFELLYANFWELSNSMT